MAERLQKLLSQCAIASRRQAEALILAGRVSVNGVPAGLGDRADLAHDLIAVDGIPIRGVEPHIYLMLNKPRGYVTTLRDEQDRKTVAQLVSDCGARVFPVGRLDMDSEGLLIFTNDGELANLLMHPAGEINKTYRLVVRGFGENSLQTLEEPIELDGRKIAQPAVRLLNRQDETAELEITIHEGRNRQIRRMCEHAGLIVTRLRRISEGSLRLGALQKGTWRFLTADELRALRKEVGMADG